jgi:uncharacterized protein GlcG (DUF336 family)
VISDSTFAEGEPETETTFRLHSTTNHRLIGKRKESTTVLSLTQSSDIVDAALSKARELGLRPLAITVLDPGGHPVVVKREDGAGILRPQIAHAKAWGCLGTGAGGAAGARHATRDPAFFAALAAISEGRIASSRGGVLIRDAEGNLLGSIGVSGDRPENDEACAVAGVESVGLVADAG